MGQYAARRYRAGDDVTDQCDFCAAERRHMVSIADGDGRIVRAICDTCRSEHRFHGPQPAPSPIAPRPGTPRGGKSDREPFPLVSERERRYPQLSADATRDIDIELLIRRIIREESGITGVVPADKWRDGQLVLRPGREGIQEKSWPIEAFFHKVVMLRNRLRVLEQQIHGASEIPEAVKVKLGSYVTGCYGTLTSFNVLFADEEDQFKGTGGSE